MARTDFTEQAVVYLPHLTVKCDKDHTSNPWKQYQITLCLSIHMKQLSSHQKNSHEILYLNIFQTSVKKVQVSLKSYKNNKYFK